ncbi:MAG TPA: hypothetical protein VF174_11160 [Micromonosporaceae bacterium]
MMSSRTSRAVALGAATLLLVVGCGTDIPVEEPLPFPTQHADAAATPSGAPSAGPPEDLWPGGMGPYLIGASLTDLEADGLIASAAPADDCPERILAKGMEEYDTPTLAFRDGKLIYLMVDTPLARTAEGARVTMSLNAIRKRHPDGERLTGGPAGPAWFVTEEGKGLLFQLDSAGRVTSIEAGTVEMLRTRYKTGKGC